MQNLIDYSYVVKNYFTVDECNNIIKKIESEGILRDNGSIYPLNGHTEDKDLITELQTKWEGLKEKYTRYIESLSVISPNISGNTKPIFVKYVVGHGIENHADHIFIPFCKNHICRPVLSAVTLLNKDFEGGEFYILEQKIDMEIGDTIIFPSMFLYPHKVTPVSDGVRYSMGVWFW